MGMVGWPGEAWVDTESQTHGMKRRGRAIVEKWMKISALLNDLGFKLSNHLASEQTIR
jgi:hypothetical protein